MYTAFEDEVPKFGQTIECTFLPENATTTGKLAKVTSRPEEVIPQSDIVLVCCPGFAHESLLQKIIPHLQATTLFGAFPAAGGFNFMFKSLWKMMRPKEAPPTIFGATSLPWAARAIEYGKKVHLFAYKTKCYVCFDPAEASNKQSLLNQMKNVFEELPFQRRLHLEDGGHFLTSTLWNANQVLHPGVWFGLFSKWDGKPLSEAPLWYTEMDEFTASVLDQLSNEIQTAVEKIMKDHPKFDLSKWKSLYEYNKEAYAGHYTNSENTKAIFDSLSVFSEIRTPMIPTEQGYLPNFKTRYLTEDLPHGLVPIRQICEMAAVPTPFIDTVIEWAQGVSGQEYLINGKLTGKDCAHSGLPSRWGLKTIEDLF